MNDLEIPKVNWDFDSQRYYWYPEPILAAGTTESEVEFGRDVFMSLADNERIPATVISDFSSVYLKFDSSELIWERLPDDFASDSTSSQFWRVKNLAPGMNKIKFWVCSPTEKPNENPILPSTTEEWIVCVTLAVIVQVDSLSPEQKVFILDSFADSPSYKIEAALSSSIAPYSSLQVSEENGETIETKLRQLVETKSVAESQAREGYAMWGMTREFVVQDSGRDLTDDDWLCLASRIQELCEYYAIDQLSQSCELAIEDLPASEESSSAVFARPEVNQSLTPMSDSSPVFFVVSRKYTEEHNDLLSDEQWASVQSSILNEINRYVLRDLPKLLSEMDHSNCSHRELELRGL